MANERALGVVLSEQECVRVTGSPELIPEVNRLGGSRLFGRKTRRGDNTVGRVMLPGSRDCEKSATTLAAIGLAVVHDFSYCCLGRVA